MSIQHEEFIKRQLMAQQAHAQMNGLMNVFANQARNLSNQAPYIPPPPSSIPNKDGETNKLLLLLED